MAKVTLTSTNTLAISLVALISLFLFLATIAIALRIWSRRYTRHRFCLDDYAAFLALFFLLGLDVCLYVVCIIGGFNVPLHGPPDPTHLTVTLKANKVGWLMWAAANTCARLSILHLIYTIFAISAFARWGVYFLSTANVLFISGCLIEFAAICRPFNAFWRPDIGGACGNIKIGYLAMAICNLVLDFLLIFLPMPVLWRLNSLKARKFSISLLFATGIVICGITVARVFTIRKFIFGTFPRPQDVFNDIVLTTAEPSLGILNACLPLFPALRKPICRTRFWKRMSYRLSRRSRGSSEGSSEISEALHRHERIDSALSCR